MRRSKQYGVGTPTKILIHSKDDYSIVEMGTITDLAGAVTMAKEFVGKDAGHKSNTEPYLIIHLPVFKIITGYLPKKDFLACMDLIILNYS